MHGVVLTTNRPLTFKCFAQADFTHTCKGQKCRNKLKQNNNIIIIIIIFRFKIIIVKLLKRKEKIIELPQNKAI